mgnify:CR=1 FL=1
MDLRSADEINLFGTTEMSHEGNCLFQNVMIFHCFVFFSYFIDSFEFLLHQFFFVCIIYFCINQLIDYLLHRANDANIKCYPKLMGVYFK